jgi:hypothetical protein
MSRQDMQKEILDDIMNDLTSDYNIGLVCEAVKTYLDVFMNDELEAELNERKLMGRI